MSDLPPEALSDCFRPPDIPVVVQCLHCGREYDSYLIWWDEQIIDGERSGFWRCPTPGCGGAGFGFDIHPVDSPLWSDEPEDDDEAWLGDEESDGEGDWGGDGFGDLDLDGDPGGPGLRESPSDN